MTKRNLELLDVLQKIRDAAYTCTDSAKLISDAKSALAGLGAKWNIEDGTLPDDSVTYARRP